MKTWTVVVELKTFYDELGGPDIDKQGIEDWMNDTLKAHIGGAQFQIFECTEAPYGPQGVVLKDAKP